jgi:hypothetical protein
MNVPSSHCRYLSLWGVWASRWAVRGGQTQNQNYYNPLALHLGFEDADNGSVSDGKVDNGEEGAKHFANLKEAEHSADESVMMKFPSCHSRLQTWAVRSMSKPLFLYAAAEQLLTSDGVSSEYLCSNSHFIHIRLADFLQAVINDISRQLLAFVTIIIIYILYHNALCCIIFHYIKYHTLVAQVHETMCIYSCDILDF